MLGLPLTGSTPELYHGKYVAGMYGSGEQGVWYEPSLSNGTLFQDAAGTTPVTAVEQPVGLMKDKSGRGNHAKQTTSADRPVFSARYNLLTKTEQFDDAVWTKYYGTIIQNSATAPDGTNTADTLVSSWGSFSTAAGYWYSNSGISISANVSAIRYTYRLRVKDAGFNIVQLRINTSVLLSGSDNAQVAVNLTTGQIIFTSSTGTLNTPSATCIRSSDGWCDISFTFTSSIAQTLYFGFWIWNTVSIAGDGVKGLYIWGASLVPTNQAHLPYQRVNTATDYDADPVKFPPYLKFNGTNSWMVTNSIDFTGTDKMTVFAGLRKLSDTFGTLIELSVNSPSYQGALGIFPSGSIGLAGDSYVTVLSGTTVTGSRYRGFVAPITNLLTFKFDIGQSIASTEIVARFNAVLVASLGYGVLQPSASTGNFGNYPLYLGRRAGTSATFNGNLYSLIIRGAATDDAHLTHAEKYVAYKSGLVI